ncbi:MAG: hypothetical protein RhofKO_12380 [Rhodothermales bacterium]
MFEVGARQATLPNPLVLAVSGTTQAVDPHAVFSLRTFETAEEAFQQLDAFAPLTEEHFEALPDTVSFWVAFTVKRAPGALEEWFAETQWFQTTAYAYDGVDFVYLGQTGQQLPLIERHVPDYIMNPMILLDVPATAPLTVLLRVQHDARTYQSSAVVWGELIQIHLADQWEAQWARRTFASALYFGGMIALGIFHVVLFLSLGSRAYLWYAAVMITWGLYWGDNTGVISSVFYPETWAHMADFHFYALLASIIVMHAFSVILLELKEHAVSFYRALVGIMYVAIPIGLLALLQMWEAATMMAALWALIGLLLQLIIAATLAMRRHPLGGVYLTAISMPLVGGFVYIFAWLEWLPANEFTYHAFMIGSAGQAVLFSLAVSTRIKLTEQQQRTALLEEERARQRLESLKEQDAFKSELLGLASHDLKSPLHTILGFTELLQKHVPDDDHQAIPLQSIQRSAEHMLAILEALLQTSAIEQGRLTLEAQPVELSHLLHEVTEAHQAAAQAKQQQLCLEGLGSGIEAESLRLNDKSITAATQVMGNPTYLRSVFDNLVSNAIKYAPAGATTTVSLARIGEELHVDVKDEGPGLSQEDQRRLFQPFQRLTPQPTGGESSTGVGLMLAKRLVELHGGHIHVRSMLGKGSTFTVVLPHRDHASAPPPSAVPSR